MTPEQQRIAIAESQGWTPEMRKKYAGEENVKGWGFNTHLKIWEFGRVFVTSPTLLPDYLNDRNAMIEAVASLSKNEITRFGIELSAIMDFGTSYIDQSDFWSIITQPLSVISEAYLRTIGKWEE